MYIIVTHSYIVVTHSYIVVTHSYIVVTHTYICLMMTNSRVNTYSQDCIRGHECLI